MKDNEKAYKNFISIILLGIETERILNETNKL